MAVIAVILYHTEQFGFVGGYLGVDLFFVLSGFLITGLLLREHDTTGRINLAEFWARRARRLLPAVLVLLATVTMIWPTYGGRSLRGDALSALMYVANWRFIAVSRSYFADIASSSPLQHLWSLAIEEQFYVVWPLAMVGLLIGVRSRYPRLVPIFGVGAVASALWLAALYAPADPSRAYFGTLARSHELLIGAIAAVIVATPSEVTQRVKNLSERLVPVLALLIAGSFVLLSDESPVYYRGGSLLFSLAAVVLLLGLESTSGVLHGGLSAWPLVRTGKMSYGLYLWHWPIIVFLAPGDGPIPSQVALLAVVLTFLVASVSFYVVEQPIRHGRLLGWELTNRRVAMAVPIAISLVAAVIVGRSFTTREADWVAADLTGSPVVALAEEPISRTLAVVGDSVVVSLLPGIQGAANAAGWDVVVGARRGCSMAGGYQVDPDGEPFTYSNDCDAHVPAGLAEMVAETDPDLVLWYSGRENDAALRGPKGEIYQPGTVEHAALLRSGMEQSYETLNAEGAFVVVVEPLPLKGTDPTACVGDEALSRACVRVSQLQVLREMLRDLAAEHKGLAIVSLADVVCGPGPDCPRVREGVEYRPDGGHFDNDTARLVGPDLVGRVLAAADGKLRDSTPIALPDDTDPALPEGADLAAAYQVVKGGSVNTDPRSAAEGLLVGTLQVGSFGARDVSAGIDWSGRGESRSYLRLLHGHFIVNDLAAAYEATGDAAFLDAAYSHVRSWKAESPIDAASSDMAWHDETTARRLVSWLGLLVASEGYDEAAVAALWEMADEHAALLATEAFHATGTNHGMFQDQALLAYASVPHPNNDATSYLPLARARLLAYFESILSVEGVHLEHSPAYHQQIALSIARYGRYFDAIGDSATAQRLWATITDMAQYATYVIKPDGTLPLIGDTFADDIPRAGAFDVATYLYAVTAGAQGERPAAVDAVFPEAGYAIFRDQWSADGQGTYIHFTAAYHTSYHKHSDDLSVWVYHDGDLLTEAGPNGYDYEEPLTEYAYSSAAHNTLLVDGEGLPRVDGDFDSTFLDSYETGTTVSMAAGVTTRFDGVRHEREVVFDRSAVALRVSDRIETDDEHRFTILWHLAPDIEATIDDEGVVLLKRDGESVARVAVDSREVDVTVRLAPDDANDIRSLRLGGAEPRPSMAIVLEFVASDKAELVTSIELFR